MQPEPRTRQEMAERYRAACRRQAEAAHAHQRRTARAAFDASPAGIRLQDDAVVYQVLDPDQVARTPRRIVSRVAIEHGVSVEDIRGRGRGTDLVEARRAVLAALVEAHPDISLHQLGAAIGRDHTTVLHHLRAIGLRVAGEGAGRPAEVR